MVKLVSFAPFQGAQQALENINEISEGLLPDYLHTVLDANLPRPDKKQTVSLGVSDRGLAGRIKDAFPGVDCQTGETTEVVADLLRGIRLHSEKLMKQLQEGDVERAQLGLGHSYSRAKVKFNVNRNDNHIIQAIATLDHLDKAVNTFSMRVREWYSWHFPELIRIVSDNYKYAKLALFVGDKKTLSEDKEHDLAAIVDDDAGIASSIIDAAKVSMGQDISEQDMINVMAFARRVVSLTEYRKSLSAYLIAKMSVVAPNLASLIGETVGARLISHAGSLTNLAKYPASTVQILGAEKALFRALKTKGNTPKYGLIYHSSFIGRAGMRNKGRISRFLANKCSMASRIDNFSEMPSTRFGEALKAQVEERLDFYASGTRPTKNVDAMKAAMDSVLADINVDDGDDALQATSAQDVVPAVDTDMQDVIPLRNDRAKGGDKKAKELAKEEKRRMKEEKKHKRRIRDTDLSMQGAGIEGAGTAEKTVLDGASKTKDKDRKKSAGDDVVMVGPSDDEAVAAAGDHGKKKRKKHRHGKD